MKKSFLIIVCVFLFTAYCFPQGKGWWWKYSGGYQSDTKDWITRVEENGGTITASTKNKVDDFIKDVSSIRSKLKRINLFCGSDTGACFIPVIDDWGLTYDVNVAFAPADYSENVGLTGNGTTKRLRTGVPCSQFDSTKSGIGAYLIAENGVARCLLGVFPNPGYLMLAEAASGTMFFYNRNGGSATTATMGTGFWVGCNYSTATCSLYVDGAIANSGAGITFFVAEGINQVNIFARGTGATTADQYSPSTLGGYIVAEGLTPSDVVLLNTAMERFQDALGRGVQ